MKKYNLLVVAHPDDETIFFGGLLQVYRRKPWKVICVTDGNAGGEGDKRRADFAAACRKMRVASCEMWDFVDRYDQRLDVDAIVARLAGERPTEMFTHGPLGEYGHPHHQDVSLAVHRAFATVWSPAYNAYAEKVVRLPRKLYKVKCDILSKTYFSETHRFARHLPATSVEGFAKVDAKEVAAIHAYLRGGPQPRLKAYAWFAPYLETFRQQSSERPF